MAHAGKEEGELEGNFILNSQSTLEFNSAEKGDTEYAKNTFCPAR